MGEIMECSNCMHMERTVAGGYQCSDPGPWCHYVAASASPSPDYPALLVRCKLWLEWIKDNADILGIYVQKDKLGTLLADLEKAGV